MYLHQDHEKTIQSHYNYFLIFAGLSIVIPSISFLCAYIYFYEDQASLFQRSGFIMVIMAAASETNAFRMNELLSPRELVFVDIQKFQKKYILTAKRSKTIATILIAVGTIIWGYGDLIL